MFEMLKSLDSSPVNVSIADVVDCIMSFFLTLFQSLRVQMGVPLTEQIVQSFMGRFSKLVEQHFLFEL